MASPNQIITWDHTLPANYNEALVIRPTLNQTPLFFPYNHYYYFSPPPIYFISNTYLFPPTSIFVSCPFWYINPNPNIWFESIQEPLTLQSTNPSQELSSPTMMHGSCEAELRTDRDFGRRRIVHVEDESHDDPNTTVMLRNIPNKYTREMMIEFLDSHCEEANEKEKDGEFCSSAYDFFYLPFDFRTGMNKGYAFVNFTSAEAVRRFKVACNQKPWSYCCSKKVLEIVYARIQGKDDLVKHFEQMTYPVEAYSAVSFTPARTGRNDPVQTIIVGKCTTNYPGLVA